KLLVTTGMRNASIDVAAAVERKIVVCGTAGLPYPTAELSWGLILALFRHIPTEDRATREGRWQVSCGLGLNGKTLGVVGPGRARSATRPRWSPRSARERSPAPASTSTTRSRCPSTIPCVTFPTR